MRRDDNRLRCVETIAAGFLIPAGVLVVVFERFFGTCADRDRATGVWLFESSRYGRSVAISKSKTPWVMAVELGVRHTVGGTRQWLPRLPPAIVLARDAVACEQ